MADKSKYQISFVSRNEDTNISDLEALLEQRFKFSPARAKDFFLGHDKITTSSLDKAKMCRAYFLQHGVVVSIATGNQKRPYRPAEEAPQPAPTEQPDLGQHTLAGMQQQWSAAEQVITSLATQQKHNSAKIQRLEQALKWQQDKIQSLLAAQQAATQDQQQQAAVTTDSTADANTATTAADPAASKPPKRRKTIWRILLSMVFLLSLAGAWLFYSTDRSINSLLHKLPFVDATPAIATALEADEASVLRLIEQTQTLLQPQGNNAPAIAQALLQASQATQLSIEGLIAIVEVERCTSHQFSQDYGFLAAHLHKLVWQHLTPAQLLQQQVISKDTFKLVQLGTNDNCNSPDSNPVVTKLAFDAYLQNHLNL